MCTVSLNDSTTLERRVYFDIRLLDGTPANGENGLQPEVQINGGSWNPVGIGPLVFTTLGSYYADLDNLAIQVVGDIIQTRYLHAGVTLLSRGDTFQVIDSTINNAQPTISALSFDSYSDVNEGDIYFRNRVNSVNWAKSTNDQKLTALRHATRLIDRLNFQVNKADPKQLLQFPRGSSVTTSRNAVTTVTDTVIPPAIKFACCEIAIKLLDGVDPDLEIETLTTDSQGYGSAKTVYNRKFIAEHTLAGIPSATAWSYLYPFLRDIRNIVLSRVD